jgi:hypothetical protein
MTLHRSYSIAWALIVLQIVAVEAVALTRRRPGDTLSEHVWSLLLTPAGAFVIALLVWCLYHFAFGHRREMGWPDAVAVLAGLGLWLVAKNNQGGL